MSTVQCKHVTSCMFFMQSGKLLWLRISSSWGNTFFLDALSYVQEEYFGFGLYSLLVYATFFFAKFEFPYSLQVPFALLFIAFVFLNSSRAEYLNEALETSSSLTLLTFCQGSSISSPVFCHHPTEEGLQ